MHINDAVFRRFMSEIQIETMKNQFIDLQKKLYLLGKPSESIDHVLPRSQGGLSTTENVCLMLSCNGDKSDENAPRGIENKNFMIQKSYGYKSLVRRGSKISYKIIAMG